MNIEVDFSQSLILITLRFTHTMSMWYLDLNGSGIEILEKPPSPLEFARLVHISRPVIIKGISVLFSPTTIREPE